MKASQLPAAPAREADSSVVLALEAVTKRYDAFLAVDRLDLSVRKGELLTLLGPSGSGKTTTLMMLAGLAFPDSGRILMNGNDITYMPAQHRNMGVVFQSYALFPHLTVLENVAFSLRARGIEPEIALKRAKAALEMTHLGQFDSRLPAELSGGQQQRVALARSLVFGPTVMLMDEPLGALDKNLRAEMQSEIREIQRELGIAIVHVTHDQEEALAMSDRIAVMADGRLRQVGSPRTLYRDPVDTFVASFLGEANLIPGEVLAANGGVITVALASGSRAELQSNKMLSVGQKISVCIRPERISLVAGDAPKMNVHRGHVRNVRYLGDSSVLLFETDAGLLKVKSVNADREPQAGEPAAIGWKSGDGLILTS